MLRLFYGPDTFRRNQALRQFTASLGDQEMLALNTTRFEGRSTSLDEILVNCDTIPFMADHRLVIVKGFVGRFERTGRKASQEQSSDGDPPAESGDAKAAANRLAEYAQRMPPTSELVLLDDDLKASNPVLGAIRDAGEVAAFPFLQDAALERWLAEAATAAGASLQPGAAKRLLATPDTWLLWSELHKVAAYAGGREITAADVELLVNANREEASVFRILDMTLSGQQQQALAELKALFDEGTTHPLVVLTLLVRQYRHLLLAQALRRRGYPQPEIGRALGITKDYTLRKTMQQAGRFPQTELERRFKAIAETEFRIKSGEVPPELGIELLVAGLAAR